MHSEKDLVVDGSGKFQRAGNTSEFSQGVDSGQVRLPSNEVADPQMVYQALDKVAGNTKIKQAFVIKFFNEINGTEPENASYLIRNPSGVFSIRNDADDKLGHRVIDQKFGDFRYMKRTEMLNYARMSFMNEGYLTAKEGIHVIPGSKFAISKSIVDADGIAQVDTSKTFMSLSGTSTVTDVVAGLDIQSEVENQVNMESTSQIFKLESQAVGGQLTIPPANLAKKLPQNAPAIFGKIPTFSNLQPKFSPSEINDWGLQNSTFVFTRPFKELTPSLLNDLTGQVYSSNSDPVATFGGTIGFAPAQGSMTEMETPNFSPSQSTDLHVGGTQAYSFAQLVGSRDLSGAGQVLGGYWDNAIRGRVSKGFAADTRELFGGVDTSYMNDAGDAIEMGPYGIHALNISKMFYNKGIEFYSSTQGTDDSEVVAGTGMGFTYQLDQAFDIAGRNLRHMFSGPSNEQKPSQPIYSRWDQLKHIPGWFSHATLRFRRNTNPTNNMGYDGAVIEYGFKPGLEDQKRFSVGLYTYDEDPSNAFSRVGFKIAVRSGLDGQPQAELWQAKFNTQVGGSQKGIVDFMMDTLAPNIDPATGQTQYQPKFYSVTFGFRKVGATPNLVRPFVQVDNVYMEGNSDIDLSAIWQLAYPTYMDSEIPEMHSKGFNTLGILCGSLNPTRTGGPVTDIFSYSQGFSQVIQQRNFNNTFWPTILEGFDDHAESVNAGRPIDEWDAALQTALAGPGYSTQVKRKCLLSIFFCTHYLGAVPRFDPEVPGQPLKPRTVFWNYTNNNWDGEYPTARQWVEKYYGPMYYGVTTTDAVKNKSTKLVLSPNRATLQQFDLGADKVVFSYDKSAFRNQSGFRFQQGLQINSAVDIYNHAGDKPQFYFTPDAASPGQYSPQNYELVNQMWLKKALDVQSNGGAFELAANSSLWRASTADDFVGLDTVFNAGNNFKTLAIPFTTHGRDKIQQVQVFKKLADRYVQIIPNSITIKNPSGGQPLILITMSSAIDIKVQL